MGVKVEMEHVNDKEKTKEITLDHLSDFQIIIVDIKWKKKLLKKKNQQT
jgi:hypothetical protein